SATSRTTTAADGSYTVADLAPGSYIVSASLPGLRTVSKDVQVAAGATVSLDLVVQPITLEAVTVTAMLREQQLKDVPFSVAAPTAQALITRGADNIETVARMIGACAVGDPGAGQSQPAIRAAAAGPDARGGPGGRDRR